MKLTVLVLALVSAACAKIVVVPVTPGAMAKGVGVLYALPKTVIKIQMKVDKTTASPAPYQKFAPIFAPGGTLACKECVDKKKETYSIQRNATVGVFGVPDPDHIYLVQFAGGGAIDQTLSMSWNEAGLASNVASSVTNKTTDVVLAGLKAGTSLAMKGAGFGGAAKARTAERACTVKSANDSWVIPILANEGLAAQSALLVQNWCDIDVKERNDKFHSGDKVKLEEARDAYIERVLDLAVAHARILRGESQSFEPVALAGKLEIQIEQQMRSLYLGRKDTTTWEPTLNLTPTAAGLTSVFRFGSESGVCPIDSFLAPESAARPSEISRAKDSDCLSTVDLSIEYHPRESEQLFSAAKRSIPQVTGAASFRYTIPAQVRVRLTCGDVLHASALLAVAQLGHVVALPARRNSKGLSYELAFIEATGGLKSFKLTSTGGIESGAIDSASGIAGSVLDARTKEAAKSDEMVLLKREADILELKKKICDAQKALGEPCRFAE